MSHFYGSLQGNRGQATRQGTAKSGIDGHIRGWKVGARVECRVNENGQDVISVCATHGSMGGGRSEVIAEFTEESFDLCRYCTHLKDMQAAGEQYVGGCELGLRPFYCGKYEVFIKDAPNLIDAARQRSKQGGK